jgi:YHS domain-containing protein
MKYLILITVLAIGSALGVAMADKAPDKPAASQPATQSAPIFNKKCPISGEDVDPKGKTVMYKGKKIGFCCDDCIEKFEKDPEKYMKDLK